MANRLVIFDIESLKDLLVHYSEGEIPLSSEAVALDFSPILKRYISVGIRSAEWKEGHIDPLTGELDPYHFRYEGQRTMNLGNLHDTPEWSNEGAIEAPKQTY